MKKTTQKITSFIMTAALALGTIMVPGTSQAAGNLKVTVSRKSIAVNTKTTIKTNVKATFKTSNKKVATVNSKGVVTGKKAGKAKITVTSKANTSQKKKVTITVNDLVIKKPAGAKATLKPGSITVIKANLDAAFVSSNPNVATVETNGIVTAKSAGAAVITVTSKKFKKLVKTVTITVVDEQPATQAPAATTAQVVVPSTEASTAWQPATQAPVTEVPTTAWLPSTQAPVTEAPTTAWQPATQAPVTEVPTTAWQPATQAPVTETPTTQSPSTEQSTEDAKLIAIEAEYKAEVISVNYYLDDYGIILYGIYDNGLRKPLSNYVWDMSVIYKETNEIDRKKYKTYTVEYGGFETELTVRYISEVKYSGEFPEDLFYAHIDENDNVYEAFFLERHAVQGMGSENSDYVEVPVTDMENVRFLGVEGVYYYVVYDYIFYDDDGNKLYKHYIYRDIYDN